MAGASAEESAAPLESDESLAGRVQAGDATAFDVLARRHLRRAVAVAYRILSHAEDAEDAAQDAFIAALGAIDRYDATRPFAPWFYRIVVTRALNVRASRGRRDAAPLAGDEASGDPSPHEATSAGERAAQVRAAVARLPEKQRLAVQLVELEGFTSAEAAEVLGSAAVTVRWNLLQARRALRATLAPLREEDPA